MNTPVRYIKSFSKGQITIPKEIRDEFGMENDFWLKLYTQEGKIIAEPIGEKKMNKKEWTKMLLTLKTNWFDEIAETEIKKNRQEIEDRLKKQGL